VAGGGWFAAKFASLFAREKFHFKKFLSSEKGFTGNKPWTSPFRIDKTM
jgi:hypothetical protein